MSRVVKRSDPSRYQVSANTPDFDPAEWIINPPSFDSLHGSVSPRHWKLNHATAAQATDIEEMSQAEKDALTAADEAAAAQQEKDSATSAFDAGGNGRAMRAIARALLSEINDLRALHSLPAVTMQKLRQDIRVEIER